LVVHQIYAYYLKILKELLPVASPIVARDALHGKRHLFE
jgi:hypothetical protein